MNKVIFVMTVMMFIFTAQAETKEQYPFNDKVQAKQFHGLINELRCLVCQNQNLLDSNATLAVDLKNKVYKVVVNKKSNREIKAYLRQRYGDFIFFKPPVIGETYVLWFAPMLMLLIGLIVFLRSNFKRQLK